MPQPARVHRQQISLYAIQPDLDAASDRACRTIPPPVVSQSRRVPVRLLADLLLTLGLPLSQFPTVSMHEYMPDAARSAEVFAWNSNDSLSS